MPADGVAMVCKKRPPKGSTAGREIGMVMTVGEKDLYVRDHKDGNP